MTRTRWVLALLLGALLALALFGLPLYGQQVLKRLPGGYRVRADSVGGPLWAPVLRGASVVGPGVRVEAGELRVRVRQLNPFSRVLRFSGGLRDATVDLDLKKVLSGQQSSGWSLMPQDFAVQNVRVKLNNTGYNLPNARLSASGENGRLRVRAETLNGTARADIRYQPGARQLRGTAQVWADATLLNTYWNGVRAGVLSGRYTFDGGDLHGDLLVSGGEVVLLGDGRVRVHDIGGSVIHDGDRFRLDLSGRSFGGPVSASADIDTARRLYTATLTGAPTLAGVGAALGTRGSGALKLTARVSGWKAPDVSATLSGSGELAGISLKSLQATYRLQAGQSAVGLSATTAFAGEAQSVWADWKVGGAGRATLRGRLLGAPLDVRASAQGGRARLQGSALGGPLTGRYNLKSRELSAELDARWQGLALQASAAGTPDDVRLRVARLAYGPLELSGGGRWDASGGRLDLGAASLKVDRRGRGSWQLNNLSAYGTGASGGGRLDLTKSQLGGQVALTLPGGDQLGGPLSLDWAARRGRWNFGAGEATWDGAGGRLALRGLKLAGLTASGDLTYQGGEARGQLTASGAGGSLRARLDGRAATYGGAWRGVSFDGETRLSPGLATRLRVEGADLSATLNFSRDATFEVKSGSDLVSGRSTNGRLSARGKLDLAALGPLAGLPDLSGRVTLDVRDGVGSADVRARVVGADVKAAVALRGQTAQLTSLSAAAAGARLSLAGPLFPRADLSGTLRAYGSALAARLSGEPLGPRWALSGTTAETTLGGVTLPAQALSVAGTLAPFQAKGSWGDLNLALTDGQLSLNGGQNLSVFGRAGRARVAARLGPNWAGNLDVSATLGDVLLRASGPWPGVGVSASGTGWRAGAQVDVPARQYQAKLRGQLENVLLDAGVAGTGADFRASGTATDAGGGSASFEASSPGDWRVNLDKLSLRGETLSGALSAVGGKLSGQLRDGAVLLGAREGRLRLSGERGGVRLNGAATLTLPGSLTDVSLSASGPWGRAELGGGGNRLGGRLTLKAQQAGALGVRAAFPGLSVPLAATLSPLSGRAGGLSYRGGSFGGALSLPYTLGEQGGSVRLSGQGEKITAMAGGPVTGEGTLWPEQAGRLSADLAPFAARLPEQLRDALRPGRLRVALGGRGATASLSGATYLGEPLNLQAAASWTGTPSASGELTHAGSHLSFELSAGGLNVRGARLSAAELRPWLNGQAVTGGLTGDLSLPGFDVRRGVGEVQLDVRQGGRRARGDLTLRAGQLSADLSSTLNGRAAALTGELYPRAGARFAYGDLTGTLAGDWGAGVRVAAAGQLAGREARLSGTVGAQEVSLSAELAGVGAELRARRDGGAWRGNLSVLASDLRPLLGRPGQLSGSAQGNLQRASGTLRGTVAGVEFSAPLRWQDGALSLQNAAASVAGVEASGGGQLYPALGLKGQAEVQAGLPGRYRWTARGTLARPELSARGTTRAGQVGPWPTLNVPGSEVTAHLLGQGWVVRASGAALSGEARGTLSEVTRARFALDGELLWPGGGLTLRGDPGWSAAGWSGDLTAKGRAYGQSANLAWRGAGELKLSGRVGAGELSARLPADLVSRPGGALKLQHLDIGALWGRGGQLTASGRADLGGSWAAPRASLSGRLSDAAGQLSGDLSGSFAGGALSAALEGPALKAEASWRAGAYRAGLSSGGLDLARLLPPAWNVPSLRFAGRAEAAGDAGGLSAASLQNLRLSGVQARAGAFELNGTLGYTPANLSADLSGRLLGGSVTVRGALPDGVAVALKNVQDKALGELSGTVSLSGNAVNPRLGGRLTLSRPELEATADLGGSLRDPRAELAAEGRGAYSGRLRGALSGVRLSPPGVSVRLSGEVARGPDRLTLDLTGAWPKLRGEAEARLAALPEPVQITGDGTGAYRVDAGALGSAQAQLSGLVPEISARGTLTPLAALDAGGSGTLRVDLAGPVSAPRLTVAGVFRDVTRSGMTLKELAVSGGGPPLSPALSLAQGGRQVGQLRDGRLSLNGLALEVADSQVAVTGEGNLGGARATLALGAALSGQLSVLGGPNALSVRGTLEGAGARASLDFAGSRALGWAGGGRVSAPEGASLNGVLTDDLIFKLGGAWTAPRVSGAAGLLGAAATLQADGRGARLTLADGPDARASGELRLSGGALSGEATLARAGGRASVRLGGRLTAPTATLNAAYGGWTAAGDLTPRGGALTVSDGKVDGRLTLSGGRVRLDLPGLDLAALGLEGVRGRVRANGGYQLAGAAGAAQVAVTGAASPLRLPVLDLPLAGDLTGQVRLEAGALSIDAGLNSPDGQVKLSARRAQSWSGQLSGRLGRGGGELSAALSLENGLVSGQLTSAAYPLKLGGRALSLSGKVQLKDNALTLEGTGQLREGAVSLSGGGDLSALLNVNGQWPALKLRPSGAGYALRARADGLDLAGLGLAPGLSGQLSADARFSGGQSSFVLTSPKLSLAGTALPTRVEGVSDGGGWRLSGALGNSRLSGSVAAGVVRGQLQLSAFPLGALIAAAAGPLPGRATLTGLARFSLPLADPLAGRYDVVAERLTVAAGTEQLSGGGTLGYQDRELTNVNLHLGGAGDWDLRGRYTRAGVDLRATLNKATFTPLLALVPALQGARPSLNGDLLLTLGGSYERPEASLRAPSVRGEVGGVTFALSGLSGQLAAGTWRLGGGVELGGRVAANGQLSAGGTLRGGRLANVRAGYSGDFASREVGRARQVVAEVAQQGGAWTLTARAVQGGTLSVTGRLAPQLDLTVSARAFAPQIGAIFAKQSVLSGDLTVRERGADIAVGGRLSAVRLVLGRVNAPDGLAAPGGVRGAAPESFASTLPPELVTFPAPGGGRAVNPLLKRIVFDDVALKLPNGAQLDENLVRADFEGGLILRGRASEPKLQGRLTAVRGTLFLRENEFALRQASATWDGASAYPDIGVLAGGTVPDAGTPVGVNVSVHGTFEADGSGGRALALDTHFVCSANCAPGGQPLSESDLYALVAFGTADAAALPGELTQSALKTALNVFFVGEVERGLAKALGLDVLRIRTNLLSGESDFSVQLTLGAYLTREFYLQYQVDLSGQGLLDARYTTQDGRFTFSASSPLRGLDFATLNPSFAVAYNFTPRSGVQFGVTSGRSTTFKLGYTLRY